MGDFTAVLEAGVPFAEAQATFAEHGQRLALGPARTPAARRSAGSWPRADSGPLRHRYGGVRDLVVGTTVVLSDGTIAKSGGKVIKNVAGYDLAKLFAGSFGTLGLIATISVRLHPLPETDRHRRHPLRRSGRAAGQADRARAPAAGGRLLRRRLEGRLRTAAAAVLRARRPDGPRDPRR